MHATGPITIASIQAASNTNSIHRGWFSVKRASPTHIGCWLAQTNNDVLMTHHTTDNSSLQPRPMSSSTNIFFKYLATNQIVGHEFKVSLLLQIRGVCTVIPCCNDTWTYNGLTCKYVVYLSTTCTRFSITLKLKWLVKPNNDEHWNINWLSYT